MLISRLRDDVIKTFGYKCLQSRDHASIYRQSTENNPNFCRDSVKSTAVREDRSVVSLRAYTNMHLGLSKIVPYSFNEEVLAH